MDIYTEKLIRDMEKYINSCKFTFISTDNIVVSKKKMDAFFKELKGYPQEEEIINDSGEGEQKGIKHKILEKMRTPDDE